MAHDKKANIGAIVGGLAAVTAAAVGAYYLYGHEDAKKHRAKVKGWMLKAKGEVLEQLEGAQEVTESAYMGAVDAVMKKYNELKNIDPAELEAFIGEMKDHWNGIRTTIAKASARGAGAPAKKRSAAKKPAKKAKR